MAESETIERLRWSLGQKRMQADDELREAQALGPLPSFEEVLQSEPVRFATEHPVLVGVTAGMICLIGPARLLRGITVGIGLLQSVRALRGAQRMLMKQP